MVDMKASKAAFREKYKKFLEIDRKSEKGPVRVKLTNGETITCKLDLWDEIIDDPDPSRDGESILLVRLKTGEGIYLELQDIDCVLD